jgi:cell division transport system permease protein
MWSIFCTIKRSWSQHFVEQFSALLILTVSYSALLFVALSLTNIQSVFKRWGEVNQVNIYFDGQPSAEEQEEVVAALSENQLINSIKVVSSEQAAKNFEQRFSAITSEKIAAKDVVQFFPSYLVVNLNQERAYANSAVSLDEFAQAIRESFAVVGHVSYGKSWLRRYVSVLSAVEWVGWLLIITFMIAAVIVSSSVVKTILYTRREEIEILEFIGADDLTIYLPQVINSLMLTASAFCLATSFIYLVFSQFHYDESSVFGLQVNEQLSFIDPVTLLLLFISAVLCVTLYSAITIFNLLPRRKQALLVKEGLR